MVDIATCFALGDASACGSRLRVDGSRGRLTSSGSERNGRAQRGGSAKSSDIRRSSLRGGRSATTSNHYWDGSFSDDDRCGYQRLFPRPPGSITGEWTPRYMYDQWTPSLLREAAPEAKILILLRDPWRRFLSGVAHEERVLERDLRRANGDYLRLMVRHDAFQRSLYAEQVRRITERFDRSRVLILQYERCLQDPRSALGLTFEFLGLDLPAGLTVERRSMPPAPNSGLVLALERNLRSRLSADVNRLVAMAPDIDPELWPECW